MKLRRKVACRELWICAAAILLLAGCGLGGPGDPGPGIDRGRTACGTEVPDPTEMVVGCLVDEAGDPVSDFEVKAGTLQPGTFFGVHTDAFQPVDSATTDSAGRFSFRRLESGVFYIAAQEGSLRSMPTLRVKRQAGDTSIKLGKNILYRNGLIQGIVRAEQDGMPLPYVLCEVEGKPYAAKTDEAGRFTLYLPPGEATLVCGVGRTDMIMASGDVEVVAGDTAAFSLFLAVVKQEDVARPQGPSRIAYRYDAATGIVHLSWPPVKAGPGGVIYVLKRTDQSIGSHAFVTFFTSDTFHSDVIPWVKDEDGMVRTKPKTILYNLRTALPTSITTLSQGMVDTTISVAPPIFLGPEVTLTLLGDKAAFRVGDTALLVGAWRNPYRENRLFAWTLDSDGSGLKPQGDPPGSAGADTLAYPCTAAGRFGIRFKVTDMSGAAASALQVLEVESPP